MKRYMLLPEDTIFVIAISFICIPPVCFESVRNLALFQSTRVF